MRAQSLDTPVSLLERIKAGDEDAWGEFARKYVRVLEKWCWKWNIQNADSQDVIQETLLAVVWEFLSSSDAVLAASALG